MTKWWNALHALQQVSFVIACAATLFMIGQVVLLAVGGSAAENGRPADLHDDEIGFTVFGLRVLSVRSVIAFLAVGGWLIFALFYSIAYYALIPGVFAGILAAFAIAAFIRSIEKLQEGSALLPENTVGRCAEVCALIPPLRSGSGRVTLQADGELDAVCDSALPLSLGEQVRIVGVLSEGTVVVESLAVPRAAEQTGEADA